MTTEHAAGMSGKLTVTAMAAVTVLLARQMGRECAVLTNYLIGEDALESSIDRKQGVIELATGLGRRGQEAGRAPARAAGLLEEELAGRPARLYYRLNKRRFEELVQEATGACENQFGREAQASLHESANQACTNRTNSQTSMDENADQERKRLQRAACTLTPNKDGGNEQTDLSDRCDDDRSDDGVDPRPKESDDAERRRRGRELRAIVEAVPDHEVTGAAVELAKRVCDATASRGWKIDADRAAKLAQVVMDQDRVDAIWRVLSRTPKSPVRDAYAYLTTSVASEPPESLLARRVRGATELYSDADNTKAGEEETLASEPEKRAELRARILATRRGLA